MNPLKKMQSLVVIACKILRVIYTILNTGMKYDPERMLRDIRYPQGNTVQAVHRKESNTFPEPYRASGRPEAGQGSG